MSAVDQHAEAHRLKAEHGYGARRIGQELGISRHAATKYLAQPLPQPVAVRVADERPPVAEPVGQEQPVPRPVAEPVAEGVVWMAAPVSHVAGTVRFPRPVARSPWLRVDLSRRRGLLRDLVALARLGLQIPYVVEDVLRAFAAAYHQALATGHLQCGQGYEVQTTVRPCRHT